MSTVVFFSFLKFSLKFWLCHVNYMQTGNICKKLKNYRTCQHQIGLVEIIPILKQFLLHKHLCAFVRCFTSNKLIGIHINIA